MVVWYRLTANLPAIYSALTVVGYNSFTTVLHCEMLLGRLPQHIPVLQGRITAGNLKSMLGD